MKNHKLKLKFSCKEKWENMEGNSKEKLCLQCNKTVTDVTNFTDEELFELSKKGTSCFRVNKSQLDRPLKINSSTYLPFNKRRIPSAVTLASLSILAVGIGCSSPENSENTTTENQISVVEDTIKTHFKIKGLVIEKHSQKVLDSVTVKIMDSLFSTQTDKKGEFELMIPISELKDSVHLEASLDGYVSSEVNILKDSIEEKKVLELIKIPPPPSPPPLPPSIAIGVPSVVIGLPALPEVDTTDYDMGEADLHPSPSEHHQDSLNNTSE